MPFIKRDYSLAEGKLWTFRGWYRHGLQEVQALIVDVPLVALLAWLLHTLVGNISQTLSKLGAGHPSVFVALCGFGAVQCLGFQSFCLVGSIGCGGIDLSGAVGGQCMDVLRVDLRRTVSRPVVGLLPFVSHRQRRTIRACNWSLRMAMTVARKQHG